MGIRSPDHGAQAVQGDLVQQPQLLDVLGALNRRRIGADELMVQVEQVGVPAGNREPVAPGRRRARVGQAHGQRPRPAFFHIDGRVDAVGLVGFAQAHLNLLVRVLVGDGGLDGKPLEIGAAAFLQLGQAAPDIGVVVDALALDGHLSEREVHHVQPHGGPDLLGRQCHPVQPEALVAQRLLQRRAGLLQRLQGGVAAHVGLQHTACFVGPEWVLTRHLEPLDGENRRCSRRRHGR